MKAAKGKILCARYVEDFFGSNLRPNCSERMSKKKAIVIGAGIAGLGASVRLAVKGYDVSVYEKNDFFGGKLTSRNVNGFRFDYGPSIFTMPQFVTELFELAGKKPEDYFEYTRLDPIFHYFYDDGSRIKGHSDTSKFAESVAENTLDSKETVLKYLDKVKEINALTEDVFINRSLHKFKNFLNKETVKGVLNFGKIDAFNTMNEVNEKTFDDPKMVQFFNRYATYNGSNPYEAPGTLNVIQHYEINRGAYLPKGGMQQISRSVYELAVELGVEFHFGKKVEKIITSKNEVEAIMVEGERREADVFVSNMDVYYLYDQLLPQAKRPSKVLDQPKSGSALVFYWGINNSFDELTVHNILFAKDMEAEYEAIFGQNNVCDDPTIYINITSKKCKGDAPQGSENWFTMVNVPNNVGQDWDEIIARSRKNIIAKINRTLGTDIEPLIVAEEIMDPRRIDERYLSAFGSIYGNRFSSNFSAFFRHPNFSKEFKNLYFCGGTVHPGSSIPLSLKSAEIAVGMVV